ncbi:hypothetical protein [Microbispora sp. NPDC049125]|uniref:hypothetical protein n=1 Tax=Microbispora sp. NPDC049125 TaxID=3154929 RepID=UPI003466F4C6
MTANRTILDTLETEAMRNFEANRETLENGTVAARQRARLDSERMNKDELLEAVNRLAPNLSPSRSVKRDELVRLYVDACADNSPEAKELAALKREVNKDERVIARLKTYLDRADLAAAELKELATRPVGHPLLRAVADKFDQIGRAQSLAEITQEIIEGLTYGGELREVVTDHLARAAGTVFAFPDRVQSNGLGKVDRAETLINAMAAREFVRNMMSDLSLAGLPYFTV